MGDLSMTFAQPQYLSAIIIVLPLIGLFLAWAARRRQAALRRLGNPALIERLGAQVNRPGRRWQTALWLTLFALAMLIIAIARPQWGTKVQEVDQEGLQMMVALDVSQSMLAQDLQPSRLDRAKLEIRDLTRSSKGMRSASCPSPAQPSCRCR
jgi:Ca-activated chloride channel family protein